MLAALRLAPHAEGRAVARGHRRHRTTYCYDFPSVFANALRQAWLARAIAGEPGDVPRGARAAGSPVWGLSRVHHTSQPCFRGGRTDHAAPPTCLPGVCAVTRAAAQHIDGGRLRALPAL